jgi:hypothetical protein
MRTYCPQCGRSMRYLYRQQTYGLYDDDKRFEREYYWCEEDDVYVITETPLEKPSQITA